MKKQESTFRCTKDKIETMKRVLKNSDRYPFGKLIWQGHIYLSITLCSLRAVVLKNRKFL